MIEIRPEVHAALVDLAAKRGQDDFSSIVDEALREYVRRLRENEEAVQEALAQEGVLSPEEADEMRAVAAELRNSWR